jgi:lipopolysaccharide transport system ATP-binding protein
MHTRLAYAVAAHLDPDILMLDEVLAVGDMEFQRKCLQSVEGLTSGGKTILFVSHSMGDVIRFCTKAIWLEDGRIIKQGDSKSVVEAYSKRMLSLQSSYRAPSASDGECGKTSKDKARSKKGETNKLLAGEVSSKEDEDHPEAPGAELLSFEISDDSGKVKELFFRNEPIHITVKYRVLRDDIPIITNVHLHKDGIHVFTIHNNKQLLEPKSVVRTVKTTIPLNILNTGDYSFSLALVTPRRPKWRHVWLEEILSFKVAEQFSKERIFTGEYKGVLRPEFQWEYLVEDEDDSIL